MAAHKPTSSLCDWRSVPLDPNMPSSAQTSLVTGAARPNGGLASCRDTLTKGNPSVRVNHSVGDWRPHASIASITAAAGPQQLPWHSALAHPSPGNHPARSSPVDDALLDTPALSATHNCLNSPTGRHRWLAHIGGVADRRRASAPGAPGPARGAQHGVRHGHQRVRTGAQQELAPQPHVALMYGVHVRRSCTCAAV